MKALKDDFRLIIQVPRRIVKTGIYKYDKHPSYAGSMLIIIGFSLLSEVVGIILVSYMFFKSRIVVEDEIIKRCENGSNIRSI